MASNPGGTTPNDLTSAAMWGDKELLESLLMNGADPNFPNQQGDSALHEAAYYGEIECASLLLDHKAEVNVVGAEGKTPLHKAVMGVRMLEPGSKFDSEEGIKDNQMDLIRLLVAHGADLTSADCSGATAKDLAYDNDFYEGVDLIKELEDIVMKEKMKRERKQKLKVLYRACENGNLEKVRAQLHEMPDAINEFIHDGQNLLMCAAAQGHLNVVEYLLDNRAVAVSNPVTNYTALHLACMAGHTDVVIALLSRLPALLAIDDSPKETSLHIAAREGHVEIVRNLLAVAARAEQLKVLEHSGEEKENSDVSLYGSGNERVQMNLDALDALGEVTVDIMAPTNNDRRTPLHEAAAAGHVEIVQLIIDFMKEHHPGGNSRKSVDGLSPRSERDISSVSPSRPKETGRLTPRQGRKAKAVPGIDLMTLRGRTAFHEAAKQGHFEVMKVLLEAGADINTVMRPSLDVTVNPDLTALVQACLMNRADIVRFLLQNGATDTRLKALKRTLRVSYDDTAGLLLCYNNGVQISTELPQPRASKSSKDSLLPKTAMLELCWNSKGLVYIREKWLGLVCREVPVPQGQTAAISQVDISSNSLSDLPIALFQLKHLTQLDASRNKITELPTLPEEAGHGWNCPRLSNLDVCSNQLSVLPDCLFRLPELKEVYANSNKITHVPLSVWTAAKLSKLHLNHNLLDSFPTQSTSDLSPHPQSPPTGIIASGREPSHLPESGYQSVQTMPPFRSVLSSSNLASLSMGKSVSDSSFDDSIGIGMGSEAWSRRRKSSALTGILGTKPRPPAHTGLDRRRMSLGHTHNQTHSFVSWRFKNFHDMNFEMEDLDDLESEDQEEGSESFPLEALDLSHNKLSNVPSGLSCLAPKLQKLNVSHNRIRSLGQLNDYPPDLELLDASNNELSAAITEPVTHGMLPCSRRLFFGSTSSHFLESTTSASPSYKPCPHRVHKNLRKLSTLRLGHNALVTVELFRMVSRHRSGDLTTSFEESGISKARASTMNDPFAIQVSPSGHREISKSVSAPGRDLVTSLPKQRRVRRVESGDSPRVAHGGQNGSNSSNSGGSQEEVSPHSPSSVIISPLYPMLSTFEVSHNQLRNVPNNLHLVGNLACLVISHNPIETLPLELSYLDHLWNLEYDDCNLISPPKQDLDKYRLAADKLLYMKSLLHDAKPNESMKLMLVGLQKMGKTTLLSRLREINEAQMVVSTFNERVKGEEGKTSASRAKKKGEFLSTVGVDLGIWRYRKDLEPEFRGRKRSTKAMKSVTFYTWDFGGQEEYYVTHQCFLSTRSLYLVVWDVEKGEEGIEELGPWLHNIQARAPGSPVVIVGTHMDRVKGEDRERRKLELTTIIKDRYLVGRGPQQQREQGLPKIRDVMYVGCPPSGRDEGVADLRKALYDIAFSLTLPKVGHQASSKMKLLEQPIPASFLRLEERVRMIAATCKQKSDPPLLKEKDFREATNDVIANPRELDQAVTFLHENGVMLHYAAPALAHLYFVDPQWLCDMLAHVVTVPEVNNFIPRHEGPEAGILRISVLAHVFKGKHFPQAQRQEYIELLGKFEVALILDRRRLLVPSMLPLRPRYTIHAYHNIFPRPSVKQILARSPNTSKLFSQLKPHSSSTASSASSSTLVGSPGRSSLATTPTKSSVKELDIASHISEELSRTGLLLRRFYFMTYVPSGFWPRLISRFLTCTTFVSIVLRALGHAEESVKEMVGQVTTGETSRAMGLEWSYWKTGIELWYKGLSLLRVSEILPEGTFSDCEPSPSIFEQSRTTPLEPSVAIEDLSFELNKQWQPVHMTPNHGIEILVPDTVCPALLKRELDVVQEERRRLEEEVGGKGQPLPELKAESVWMSAGLLTQAVDFIDTLLEDWYPGLGAREGTTTVESIPYVNRVIPCPFCVSGACVTEPEGRDERESSPPSPLLLQRTTNDAAPADVPDPNQDSQPNPHRPRALNISAPNSPRVKPSVKRPLLFDPHSSKALTVSPAPVQSPSVAELRQLSESLRSRSHSSPLTQSSSMPTSPRQSPPPDLLTSARSSSANKKRSSTVKISSPIPNTESLAQPLPSENGLILASKFGFMIESCILAARNSEDMICPAHKTHPLPIRDLAPDVVFADLPCHFMLDPDCVDRGQYVDHGTFGDIYHGTVYPTPTSTDDEGQEVALKIDRLDSKKCTPDTATKSYIEVRAEVSLLHKLRHPHVIDFIGVVLQPLCFILEWACRGSLHSILQKYKKVDARIGPRCLRETALQVAKGLAYLHEYKIVYYDLKSPNVLVFQFPTPQESLQQTSQQCEADENSVYVKIADLGISRIMSPGGTMGFKGSPGFMAPEILKYVGLEAVTEKVDIYSFGMFMYEMISLHFPFEKQNLMSSQIEKLVIEGERPPLQNRELSNPILYLDIMRWCWQQDFRSRPSARQLIEVLTNQSVPRLVDAISLHSTTRVTCSAVCILPIEQTPQEDHSVLEYSMVSLVSAPLSHPYVACGDLQEDLWLGLYSEGGREEENESQICVINFKGKASYFTESFAVCNAQVTSLCCVVDTMWVGTEEGQVFIYDAHTRNCIMDRQLAVFSGQAITSISHLLNLRQVLVTRGDGCVLLFDEGTQEHKLPDDSKFDNRVNGTQLPVRAVFKTPEKLPVLKAVVVGGVMEDKKVLWCGSAHEMLLLFDVYSSRIEYCRKRYHRPRNNITWQDVVKELVVMEREEQSLVWALTQPHNSVYCWDTATEKQLLTVDCNQYSPSPVTCMCTMGHKLQLAFSSGQIFLLSTPESTVESAIELRGHMKATHSLLTVGGRTLPKHWTPSILGRSNVIDYLRELLAEDDIQAINSSLVGRQDRLLVSVGSGFYGIAGKVVEPLMSPRDMEENFLLLWSL